MPYDPEKHHRHSIRLRGYDYAQAGAFFITICAQNRKCLFGACVEGAIRLNAAGDLMEKWWTELPNKFPSVETDEHIVMPNHIHGILVVASRAGATLHSRPDALTENTENNTPRPTLGAVVDWFKTMTTNEYIRGVKRHRWQPFTGRLWQRNYYEHIIRSENELGTIRQYICGNPTHWQEDENNPARIEPLEPST